MGVMVALTLLAGIAIVVLVIGLAVSLGRRKKKEADQEPLRDTRLSSLAAMSFFSGLAALAVLVAASVVFLCAEYGDVLQLEERDRQILQASARIVLFAGLAPAVAALGFALGARGVIRGSRGRLRGRSLYRSGVILALLTAFLALTWKAEVAGGLEGGPGRSAVPSASAEPGRAWLGAEVEPADPPGAVRVKTVEEDGPAARAGIQAGDVITSVDGVQPADGKSIPAEIEGRRPGETIRLQIVNAREGARSCDVELGVHPVSELVARLREQASDDGRLPLVRAAAERRKFRVEDLIRICSAFDDDEMKREAIRAFLPGLVDPWNAHRLAETLKSADTKEKLRRLLETLPKK